MCVVCVFMVKPHTDWFGFRIISFFCFRFSFIGFRQSLVIRSYGHNFDYGRSKWPRNGLHQSDFDRNKCAWMDKWMFKCAHDCRRVTLFASLVGTFWFFFMFLPWARQRTNHERYTVCFFNCAALKYIDISIFYYVYETTTQIDSRTRTKSKNHFFKLCKTITERMNE